MLTLAEKTTLLLYAGIPTLDGAPAYDVFTPYGGASRLVGAALLMDLALRGRVRVEHPRSPDQRTPWRRVPAAAVSIAAVLLAFFASFQLALRSPELPQPVALYAPFVLVALVIAALAVISALRADKLIIIETSPLGDAPLDSTLQQIVRLGTRARIRGYLGQLISRRRLSDTLANLQRQLELQGLVLETGKRQAVFGLVTVHQVNRAHPEFRALADCVRRLILNGEVAMSDAVALSLLFSQERAGRRLFHPSQRSLRSIDQFFTIEEMPTVKRRLKEIRAGDPTITALLGNDLYDTLVAILQAEEALRVQASSSGA
jgi:hypothetical protein